MYWNNKGRLSQHCLNLFSIVYHLGHIFSEGGHSETRCDVLRVPPKIHSPWGRCACVLLVVTAMFTSCLSLCSAFPPIFITYVVFKQNGPFTSLYRLYFYSNLNWYIVYRSTKSEINKIKMDQQTEQVLSNAIDDDECKVELERMDAIAQYLESGRGLPIQAGTAKIRGGPYGNRWGKDSTRWKVRPRPRIIVIILL